MVRWKLLDPRPISWERDLNDGVRLNSLPDGRGSDGGWGVVEQIGYWRIVSTEEVTLRAGGAKR